MARPISTLVIGMHSTHTYKSIIPPHQHDRGQLLFASEGTIQVHTPDNVWIVPPMCALWIPAYMEHSVTALSQVRMNTALVESQAAMSIGSDCILIRVSNLLRELVIRLNQMDELTSSDTDPYEELSYALQILIFDEIQRANKMPIQIPWPKDKRLINICTALLNAPDDTKDLETWADKIGTSSRTLMRIFQKETGLSYRAWLQQLHIALAMSKITDGESIANIATALGYSNVSAFSVMFKRHLGHSPQYFKHAYF